MLVDPETGEEITVRLPVGAIKIEMRYRTSFGNIGELAESIRVLGLLHPVVVTPDHVLVSGHRRLEAVKLLDYPDVPVRVVQTVDSAVLMLQAERDENTCRKDMTGTELFALGKELKRLERPRAAERQAAPTRARNLGDPSSHLPVRTGEAESAGQPLDSLPGRQRTDTAVAAGLGMSETQWQRLQTVGNAAIEGDPVAVEALASIDAGELTITGAFEKVKAKAKKPPAQLPGSGNRRKHLAQIEAIVTGLTGYAAAFDGVDALDASVTAEEAARLKDDLSKQIRALNRITQLLKERTS